MRRNPIALFVAAAVIGAAPAARAQTRAARPAADTTAQAEQKSAQPAAQPPSGAVIYASDTLFVIQTPLGPFSAADRARAVEARLRRIGGDPLHAHDSVTVVEKDGASDVLVGEVMVTTVTDADAARAGLARHQLAERYAAAVTNALRSESLWSVVKAVLLGILFTLIATAALWILLVGLARVFPRLYRKIESWRRSKIPALRIQRLEIISADRMTDVTLGLARIIRVVVVVILLFYYIPLVFSFFPWTQNFASTLFGYVIAPVKQVLGAVIGYIPNLFYIAVIVLATRYALKFIRLFFDGITRETLRFQNFHAEWGQPTYKIVRFLVLAFAFVVLWPYLPGSQSDTFKGVSVFLGVLVSFGSSSSIANVMAGIVITYMRPFKMGDRVRIADTTGDVVERTLLVTRIRTIKNVDITIPNAMVLSSHIVNFSSSAQDRGVILHTGVTIGYDAPWRKVHELLIAAAHATNGVLENPKPFVFQTALDDFFVHYEINAYSEKPNEMARIYSDLHQNIQDKFNEAGVEITSPHYGALRDGNRVAIPDEYLPKGYRPPAFRVVPPKGEADA